MGNPHAGAPFSDDDAIVAAALEDVAVPALLCSLVHMTGDPSWIRERTLPMVGSSSDFQAGLTGDEQADIRRRALPVVAAYRDAGGAVVVSTHDEALIDRAHTVVELALPVPEPEPELVSA